MSVVYDARWDIGERGGAILLSELRDSGHDHYRLKSVRQLYRPWIVESWYKTNLLLLSNSSRSRVCFSYNHISYSMEMMNTTFIKPHCNSSDISHRDRDNY